MEVLQAHFFKGGWKAGYKAASSSSQDTGASRELKGSRRRHASAA
jgi:hypothetical protein